MSLETFEDILSNEALKTRRVYLWGEVNDSMAVSTLDQIYYHYYKDKTKPIHLLINSGGGLLSSCETMLDEILVLQKKGVTITTLCIGEAYSAAGILLLSGTKGFRFARPSSTIMLHPISFGLEADYADQQKKNINFLHKRNDVFNQKIAAMLGKEVKKYCKEIKDGLWMSAEEAKKYGVIDDISYEPFPIY